MSRGVNPRNKEGHYFRLVTEEPKPYRGESIFEKPTPTKNKTIPLRTNMSPASWRMQATQPNIEITDGEKVQTGPVNVIARDSKGRLHRWTEEPRDDTKGGVREPPHIETLHRAFKEIEDPVEHLQIEPSEVPLALDGKPYATKPKLVSVAEATLETLEAIRRRLEGSKD